LSERGIITYRYTFANGAKAKQEISGFALEPIVNPIMGEISSPLLLQNFRQADLDAYFAATVAALASPVEWRGSINRNIFDKCWIYWMPKHGKLDTNSVYAGRTLSGFGFNSLDLPGMGEARMDGLFGENEIFGFPDDGPLQDSAVFDELNS